MKISREWLQTFFDAPLPEAQKLSEALTFHAFEIESVENDILDVKVTPNRGHDCLSHRGIAKELSAILQIPMKADPLRQTAVLEPKTETVRVTIESPALCPRFTVAHLRGVKVGPSPEHIRRALESVGQKSINNVVDITNYVMFHLGQPLHAFDMIKLREKQGIRALTVRKAKAGEMLVGLDDKKYELTENMVAIEDAFAGAAVSIAGVKGGLPTGIDEDTTEVLLEAANWDGVTIRKTSQNLKLRTDASARFEQVLSPELAAYGLRMAVEMVLELAGGELVGFVDEYPSPAQKQTASVSVSHINNVLGTTFAAEKAAEILTRLDLAHVQQGDEFEVHVPFERLDLSIPEDLVEEIVRIAGYEHVPSVELPRISKKPEVHSDYAGSEHIRQFLVNEGYTSVFTTKGDRVVLNKVDGVKPYLRRELGETLQEVLERNVRNKDLLGLKQVKLFEIGTVWKGGNEVMEVELAVEKLKKMKTADHYKKMLDEYLVSRGDVTAYPAIPFTLTERYRPYSKYPFIVRDIALWVPAGTNAEDVLDVIRTAAGELLVRSSLFDEFKKDGRVSLAFRLVFQSFDRTLTDEDANEHMESVNSAVGQRGWNVR
jgi:phenylalanyl-tRNA synthetase beta chain